MYVPYIWPNGWTEWADIFLEKTNGGPEDYIFKICFQFDGLRQVLQQVIHKNASICTQGYKQRM